jgi:hypothetical protein
VTGRGFLGDDKASARDVHRVQAVQASNLA